MVSAYVTLPHFKTLTSTLPQFSLTSLKFSYMEADSIKSGYTVFKEGGSIQRQILPALDTAGLTSTAEAEAARSVVTEASFTLC